MDFAFTDEQHLIRDAVSGFLAEHSTSAAVRAAMASEHGFDAPLWQRVCTEMYWQATHLPEAVGGMGLGYVEIAAIMEQMGRFLFCGPFFSSVCLFSNAVRIAGDADQQARYLDPVMQGEVATLAWAGAAAAQQGGEWDVSTVDAVYHLDGDDIVISGHYRYVVDAAVASSFVVAARQAGTVGKAGIALFVLSSTMAGVTSTATPTMDQTRRWGTVSLNAVRVSRHAMLGNNTNAGSDLAIILDLAAIALAAEQVGGAQDIMDRAVAYTMERVQFGRQIASFQAIKHKAADMMLRTEVARSGVYYAACVAEELLAAPAASRAALAASLAEAASVAKSYVSDAYFQNAGEALQMHGGVGFTWEYDVHLHFKRAKASEHYLGNAAWHRERLAVSLLEGASS